MWTRRGILKAGGLAVFSVGAGPSFLPRAALGAAEPGPGGRRVLVTLFQRGAMDGLAAVPPLAGRRLDKLRPRLVGEEAPDDLGVGFGLHPAFRPWLPLWKEGRLGIVHAVGSPDPTRSHFDAQDFMETGTPGRKGTASGWLNRVSGRLGHEASPFRSVAMTRALPRSLYGPESAVALTRLEDFALRLPGSRSASQAAGQGFESLYEETGQELLRETGSETFEAMQLLSRLDVRGYRPAWGADYPRGELGTSLRQIAQLIKADVGLEVAFAESGGWDTHVQQAGSFRRRADELARAVAAFWTDLGSHRDRVTVMTMTEFGRTVRENGSGGTDHGHGSCLFVFGDWVDGGKVHGDFPGLEDRALYEERDLPVTTDFRSVFAEVAARQLGVQDDGSLFPGWHGERIDLARS